MVGDQSIADPLALSGITAIALTGVGGRATPVTPDYRHGVALFAQYALSGGDDRAVVGGTRTLSDMAARHFDLAASQ